MTGFLNHLRPWVSLFRQARRSGVSSVLWLWNTFESEYGHLQSVREGLPVTKDGEPLPWYTYPSIEYIDQLDFRDSTVFEFGSGNGSKFWARRSRHITSVENDEQWFTRMKSEQEKNQTLLLVQDPEDYARSIVTSQKRYDVVIVDGINRYRCAETALNCVNPRGLIVLDNSDWHPNTAALLRAAGLIQVDFTGFGPVNKYTWTTSLFFSRDFQMKPRGDRLPLYGIGSLVQTASDDRPAEACSSTR